MGEKKMDTQKTPQNFEIPIPKRKDVFDVLEKATKPTKPLAPRRRPKK
jgi:hypothetical protein